MILICPSCSAKFMISSDALGEEGREVRCGKCAHGWFQAPERDSLDDLPDDNGAPEQDTAPDRDLEIDFSNRAAEDIPQALRPRPASRPAPPAKEPRIATEKEKKIASVMVALAAALVFFYGFTALKNPVGKNISFFGKSYNALGFAPDTDPPKIAFDRVKLARAGEGVSGSGTIINLTGDAVEIGKLQAEALSKDKKVLQAEKVEAGNMKLGAESSEKMTFSFGTLPEGATQIRVRASD